MGEMKTKNVHEFLIPSVCLFLAISLWGVSPNALVSAEGLINFSLSDGDNVTCYPIQAQKSLLNGTKFNRYPTTVINSGNSTYHTRGAKRARQTMAEEIGACPEGTIPIRAPRGVWDDEEIGARIARMSKQLPRSPVLLTLQSRKQYVPAVPHEYGVAQMLPSSTTYKGTEVFINVWDPPVESTFEFSLGQLWVAADGPDGSIQNTIEAGYQVSKGHYGDTLPRLFVFWTADDYATTGCYELSCPGFVQVSNKVLLGGSFSKSTISLQGGQQYEIKYRVSKDDGTGDWWLQLNDEYVGYWPKAIYTFTPFDNASFISWGAEIVDDEQRDGDLHTTTEMGSGQFANAGYRKAAYQRNLQYIDMNNTLVDAPFFVFDTESNCYTAALGTDYPNWRSFFFYGGKGRSSGCVHDPVFEPPPPASSPASSLGRGSDAPEPARVAGG